MAPADPFGWVGATIDGKYRVEAAIGEGGFGVVYRGHHLGFDEPVAIKCLKLPASMVGADRDTFQKTFLEEGKLLHRLSRATAGIVQALDVGAAVSPSGTWTPFLVLEWLRGEPLDRDLADRRSRGEGGRAIADAIALLAPAARALDAAHAQGVAHRDVKPANLFLAEIGDRRTLKVLDFGIAKVLSEVSSLTAAMSETGGSMKAFTPQYGAPEQFHRRFGATGPWTDVFALALVLIEVASGRAALDGSDTTQLFIASTDTAYRPSLRFAGVEAPEAIEAVLASALAVDPRLRHRSAGELWDALEAALPEREVPPPPPSGANLPGNEPISRPKTEPTELDAPPMIEPPAPLQRVATKRGRGPVIVIAAFAASLVVGGAFTILLKNKPAALAARPSESAQGAPIPPDMVRVPAGTFTMGIATGGKTEKPAHEVTITRAFDIDRTEVTVAAYQRCLEVKRCSPSGVHGPHAEQSDVDKRGPLCTSVDPGKLRHPITCVDQAQAAAYCAFAGKRLPTEAEWEYAARGTDGREYPWGNEWPACERAVVARGPGQSCGRPKGTIEVGSLPVGASPFGLLDAAGNSWEWVADGWDPGVYAKGAQIDPRVPATGERGVLRGGSWDYSAASAKSTNRLSFDRLAGDAATGFRCARTVE